MFTARHFPEWEKMTVQEVRDYLHQRQSVILPLGVTEQHGYHLPLCTDSLLARELALRVGKRLGMIVAPTINMSFSGGQSPGTINVSPNVMGLLVGDVLRSLVVQGFRNVFMILAHGGSENMRALDNALRLLLRDDPAFSEAMLVLGLTSKFSQIAREAVDDEDWHAGWLETSAVMAVAPELVQMDKLALDAPEVVAAMRAHPDHYQTARKPVDNAFVVPRMAQRDDVVVGVMGDPSKASEERGSRFIEESVQRMCGLFEELEKTRSGEYRDVDWTPEPILL